MYFCIFEKTSNNTGWFYTRTLAHIDIKDGIELYKLKQEITHIEELFQEYCLANTNYTYRLYIKNYDPGDTNILNRKNKEVK